MNRPTIHTGFSQIALRIDWPTVFGTLTIYSVPTSTLYPHPPSLHLTATVLRALHAPLMLTLPSRDHWQMLLGSMPQVCTWWCHCVYLTPYSLFFFSFSVWYGPFRNYCQDAMPATTIATNTTTSKRQTWLPSESPNMDNHLHYQSHCPLGDDAPLPPPQHHSTPPLRLALSTNTTTVKQQAAWRRHDNGQLPPPPPPVAIAQPALMPTTNLAQPLLMTLTTISTWWLWWSHHHSHWTCSNANADEYHHSVKTMTWWLWWLLCNSHSQHAAVHTPATTTTNTMMKTW